MKTYSYEREESFCRKKEKQQQQQQNLNEKKIKNKSSQITQPTAAAVVVEA